MSRRSFLFLQGCTSPFFGRLADALADRGHTIWKVNFNVGDAVYWGRRPGTGFRGHIQGLPALLEEVCAERRVSDVIMLGDTRPLHSAAIPLIRGLGLRTHVFEEGYFRPGRLTLERDGINGYSRLPKDPDWYRTTARLVQEPENKPVPSNPVWLLALHESGYHLPNLLNPMLYPGYRTHRPCVSALEFAGWGYRFARLPFRRERDASTIRAIMSSGDPFYFFPLQLDGDSQIVVHSDFSSVNQAIEAVLRSFACRAPGRTQLVIKNHPLDTGLIDHERHALRLARELGTPDRVHYLEHADIAQMTERARGVVTINSTVGTDALARGCPTHVLGRAVYDLAGLTSQCSLDEFWCDPTIPDPALYRAFRKVVIHATQIDGSFYSRAGMALAVQNSVVRMEAERSRLEELL